MTAAAPIRVFQTAEHTCGYWYDRAARDIVLDPRDPNLPRLYAQALQNGFRRSGGHVYRPNCNGCRACVPVRIAVEHFQPDRSQRRCLKRNADVTMETAKAVRDEEAFALYRRYLHHRHRGGGMDQATPLDFDAFVSCDWSPTRFLKLRLEGRLIGVAVTDVLARALSAVYTFFDPAMSARGLGTLAILRQIEWARRAGYPHLYLGFWLKDHQKMHYKTRFQPLEGLIDGRWQSMAEPADAAAETA